METTYEDKTRWVRNTPDWRKVVEEQHGLENKTWRLNRQSQEWGNGPVDIILVEDTSSDDQTHQEEEDSTQTPIPTPESTETTPILDSTEEKHLMIQLLGVDYQISCSTQRELWTNLRQQTTVRGILRIVDDEGMGKTFEE
jgi:hypothetical protein